MKGFGNGRTMRRARWVQGVLSVSMILTLLAGMLTALRPTPVAAAKSLDPAFARVWERTDKLVADGKAGAHLVLGADARRRARRKTTPTRRGGQRLVQYFDKSRMEINNPDGDPNEPLLSSPTACWRSR